MTRLTFVWVIALAVPTLTHGDEQMVLDDFDYPSAEAAQQAWQPDEDSLPVGLMERDGGGALRMNADFTGESRRAVYDRTVDLDLSRWGRFTLDIYIDDPGLFGSFTIYFHSGNGWYGSGVPLGRKGWDTVNISRAGFRTEDDPGGWDTIDRIRLSAWRGAERTGFMAVDNLVAHRESRVIVLGTNTIRARTSEARTVQAQADQMAAMLANAGIMTSTIGDEDVANGALADFEFAIFPYNPNVSEEEAAAIAEFIAGGGRIMFFYQLPDAVGEALGIRRVGWQTREYEGQLSDIVFTDAEEFVGLPERVAQDSWNLTVVEPIEGRSKVIGWFYDAEGNNTGLPAFVASEGGIYMSHVLTAADSAAKERMLVAMLGRYLPDIWPQVAQRALDGPTQIGHIEGIDAARAWVEAQANSAADPAAVRGALGRSRDLLAEAAGRMGAGDYPAAVDIAGEAWDELRRAYTLAHAPRSAEFRAWWNHSGTGAYESWAESMANLHASGFNAIAPNMLWGGVALYDSEYLPHHPVVAERGDQIAECVEAAQAYGIEVHPWKVNWRLGGGTPESFIAQMRAEGRLQMDFSGNEVLWLCPSDPRNLELELNTMVEVARKYDVDGVHFDYIRYPDSNSCFCSRCRAAFERAIGRPVANWPEDVRSDELKDAWTQFRCDNISRLVEATAREVRAIKPDCKISAAVFGSYPACRESVGQDWVHWIEQGWLDFVCPMDYTTSDAGFASLVANQMSLVGGRIPLYPGIGAWRLVTPDRVAGQVRIARQVGADGFIVFNYSRDLAESVGPALGEAMLAQPATMPHNAPAYRFELGEPTRVRTFGLHVEPGQTVTATVRRAEDVPGRSFGEIRARVVLQDADGRTLADLAGAPAGDITSVDVQFTPPAGLSRLAVVGSYDDGEGPREFVTRSLPIVAGELAADIVPLL
ncbi:MAG: glycoside hydrolase family 10 protein [Armatimonadota bacterium]